MAEPAPIVMRLAALRPSDVFGMIATVLVSSACQHVTPPETRGAPSVSEPSATFTAGAQGDRPGGERPLMFTLADAEVIRAGLLDLIEHSSLAERHALLIATRHVTPMMEDGYVRIGGWILQAEGQRAFIRYRVVGDPLTFSAEVVRDGALWTVKDLESVIIHPRD